MHRGDAPALAARSLEGALDCGRDSLVPCERAADLLPDAAEGARLDVWRDIGTAARAGSPTAGPSPPQFRGQSGRQASYLCDKLILRGLQNASEHRGILPLRALRMGLRRDGAVRSDVRSQVMKRGLQFTAQAFMASAPLVLVLLVLYATGVLPQPTPAILAA